MADEKNDQTPEELNFAEDTGNSVGPSVTSGKVLDAGERKPLASSIKLFALSILVFFISVSVLRSLVFQQGEESLGLKEGVAHELPAPESRKALPDILLVGEGGTQSKKLSEFRGKVVLLSIWASWCTPCLVELPTFKDLHEKLSDKGLVILPLNVDEPDTAAQFVPHFWKKREFPFPTFFDPNKEASEQLEVQTLPTNIVVDKQGRQVAQGLGANDWSSETSVAYIQALLNE